MVEDKIVRDAVLAALLCLAIGFIASDILDIPLIEQRGEGLLFQAPIGYGGATISLQKVDFIYNDGQLHGENAYLMTVVIGAGAEYAMGSFDTDQMATEEGKPKYDFTMKYIIDKQTCSYPIVNTYKRLYTAHYEVRKSYTEILTHDFEEWCESHARSVGSPQWWFFRPKSLTVTYYCVWLEHEGYRGELRTPEHDFRARIVLEREDGAKYDGIIDSLDQTAVNIGDVAYANWVGYLPTRYRCPSPSDQKIAAVYVNQEWRTTDDDAWYDYSNYLSTGFTQCLKLVQEGSIESIDTCINEFNNKYYNAIRYKPFTFLGGTSKVTTSDVNKGYAVLDLPKAISYMMMTLHVKAKWLGIVIPIGEPEITRVISEPFETGQNGYITVYVKNKGSVMDKFGVSASCPAPFTVTPEYIDVPPGEERVVHLVVRAGAVATEFSSTCAVKAYSVSKPENFDTATVKVTVKPVVYCTPGKRICDGKLIKICNEQGTGYVVEKECTYTCEYRDGVPFCAEEPKPTCQLEGMTCGLFKKCCEGLECVNGICQRKKFELPVFNIIMIIAGFAAGFAIPDIIAPGMKKEYKIIMGVGIGLIAAGIVYWWVSLAWWKKLLLGIGGVGSILLYALISSGLFLPLISMLRRWKK